MVPCQHRPDRALEVRGAHHAEVGLELYLQALVGAPQLRDLNFHSFQLLRVHGDFLLQSFTLKFQESSKKNKSKERHKREEEGKEGKQRRGKKNRKEDRQKDGKGGKASSLSVKQC